MFTFPHCIQLRNFAAKMKLNVITNATRDRSFATVNMNALMVATNTIAHHQPPPPPQPHKHQRYFLFLLSVLSNHLFQAKWLNYINVFIIFFFVSLQISCPEYTCPDRKSCFGLADRCNGISECSDGYDEYGCPRKLSLNLTWLFHSRIFEFDLTPIQIWLQIQSTFLAKLMRTNWT